MAAVKRMGHILPMDLAQEHSTFGNSEIHLPPIQSETTSNIPFRYQISEIDRIIQIKAHNRDLVVKRNCCYTDCTPSRNNSNSNVQKLTNPNTSNYNTNGNSLNLPNKLVYKNDNNNTGVATGANGNNVKVRRQNQNQNQNYYPNFGTQLPPNPNMNFMNSNSQAFINNNQRKYNYFNTNYNNKKTEQSNSFSSVNMNLNSSMNLLQQLQKQQHQQQFEQQQSQHQYNLGSNQNLLESFLIQQLNNQSQNQPSQYKQQMSLFQNQFDNFSQTIPDQIYGAQSPLLFDYNLNTNKDTSEQHNASSVLSNNNSNVNPLITNKYSGNFTNNNNGLFQHQQSQPNIRATLDTLPQLNLQSIVDTQEMVSNVTTPGSISRPNSSITSLGSSVPGHANSDLHENRSSNSNTSSKNTLVDPLESIWKRDRDSSGKNTPALHDLTLENKYFDDSDKLKESGLYGKYFS